MGHRLQRVQVPGVGELEEPFVQIVRRVEAEPRVAEFVREFSIRNAKFDGSGVTYKKDGYELVFKPGSAAEAGMVWSYHVPNRRYTTFEDVIEMRDAAEEAGFPMPDDLGITYHTHTGSIARWSPAECGKDTLRLVRDPRGQVHLQWLSCPKYADPGLFEHMMWATLEAAGLPEHYVAANFRLLKSGVERRAAYEYEAGHLLDRTKYWGSFIYRWTTGTVWVDTIAGGLTVHLPFHYWRERPEWFFAVTWGPHGRPLHQARLHPIERIITREEAQETLPEVAHPQAELSLRIDPWQGKDRGGMLFLRVEIPGRRKTPDLDLETGELLPRGAMVRPNPK
jgi:hypothetical protein